MLSYIDKTREKSEVFLEIMSLVNKWDLPCISASKEVCKMLEETINTFTPIGKYEKNIQFFIKNSGETVFLTEKDWGKIYIMLENHIITYKKKNIDFTPVHFPGYISEHFRHISKQYFSRNKIIAQDELYLDELNTALLLDLAKNQQKSLYEHKNQTYINLIMSWGRIIMIFKAKQLLKEIKKEDFPRLLIYLQKRTWWKYLPQYEEISHLFTVEEHCFGPKELEYFFWGLHFIVFDEIMNDISVLKDSAYFNVFAHILDEEMRETEYIYENKFKIQTLLMDHLCLILKPAFEPFLYKHTQPLVELLIQEGFFIKVNTPKKYSSQKNPTEIVLNAAELLFEINCNLPKILENPPITYHADLPIYDRIVQRDLIYLTNRKIKHKGSLSGLASTNIVENNPPFEINLNFLKNFVHLFDFVLKVKDFSDPFAKDITEILPFLSSIYKINLYALISFLKNDYMDSSDAALDVSTSQKETRDSFVTNFLKFCFDFSRSSRNLGIPEVLNKHSFYLKSVIDIIRHKKIEVNLLLEHVLILSRFSLFYIPEFFSGHFRRFPESSYLSYHLPLAREFLSFFINDMPISTTVKENEIILTLLEEQIYSLANTTEIDLETPRALFELVKDTKIPLGDHFQLYNLLVDYQNFAKNDNYIFKNFYSLDSATSGLQIQSLYYKSLNLAKSCNLHQAKDTIQIREVCHDFIQDKSNYINSLSVEKYNTFISILATFPDILTNITPKILKQIIMTTAYHSTNFGRVDQIVDSSLRYFFKNGSIKSNVYFNHLRKLWFILDKPLQRFLHEKYPEMFYFNEALSDLVKKRKINFMNIHSPFFSYSQKFYKTFRFSIRIGQRVDKIPFYTNEIDYKKLIHSCSAVLVQFGDAHLVQFFCTRFKRYIYFFTVHDRFFCYPAFCRYLKPSLKDSYADLYKLDLIALNFNDPVHEPLKEAFLKWEKEHPMSVFTLEHFNHVHFVKH